MFRLFIWALIFYFGFKLIKYVARLLNPGANSNPNNIKENNKAKMTSRIDDKDIIDADFTEIKEEKKSEP